MAGRQPGEVPEEATPETYLGTARAALWLTPPHNGVHEYPGARRMLPDRFALQGRWRVDHESAEAVARAVLTARVRAKSVYLVLGSRGDRPRTVTVELDGEPYGTVTVRRRQLYTLVKLPRSGEHRLTLRFEPGVAGYAFTFG